MKRVGIYSGAFDPIHQGHLAFAQAALAQCKLDKVFFMVEPRPRRKQGVKALAHRSRMVQLAIKDKKQFGDIILEQQRYTVADTLPQLRARFRGAEMFMLIGDDLLTRLSDWPHIEDLLLNMHFVIGIHKFSKAEVRQRLKILQHTRGFAVQYELVESPYPAYASSKIRRALKNGHSPKGLLEAVEDYIEANGLYVATSSDKS